MLPEPLDDKMDRFYLKTGVWPPGRDMPPALCGGGEPDALAIWRLWCDREDLLAACEAAVQIIEQLIPEPSARGVADVVLFQLRAAIAKAKGGVR